MFVKHVDTSGRPLHMRISEHSNDANNNKSISALAKYATETNHKIDVDNVKIIDMERFSKKRSFSEMLYIYYHKHTLNRMKYVEFLKKYLSDFN